MFKSKKVKIFVSILFISIIFYAVWQVFIEKSDYEIGYRISGFDITEMYRSKEKLYYFSATSTDEVYDIVLESDLKSKRKLIDNAELYIKGDKRCLYLLSSTLKTYPICFDGGKRVDYFKIKDDLSIDFSQENISSPKKTTFANIEVQNLFDRKLAIWNHSGFIYFSSDTYRQLDFFEEENYADEYSFQIGKYVLIPNYDEKYNFTRFYLLDMETGKTKVWNLGISINYNFYFLGFYEDKGYIIDRKERNEYELDPKKQKINIISQNGMGKVWDGQIWKELSMTKLVNDDYHFNNDLPIDFSIEKNKIYMYYFKGRMGIEISDRNISKIVKSYGHEVFYIVNDSLYSYSPYHGEILLAHYSEWEFNKDNTIYIY